MQTTLRVLFLVWTALALPRVAGGENSDELLRLGRQALADERWAEAEGRFRQLVRLHPGLIDGYRGLASALEGLERDGEAAQILARLGSGLLEAGQHGGAAEVLGEAARLDPSSARLQALLGKAHAFSQNHLAAVAPLQRAIEMGERSAPTRLYLAAAFWETGRSEQAEAIYLAMLREDPNTFVTVHQLGRLLVWQGRHAEAVAHLRRAATMRPGAADVAYDLAQGLAGAGEAEEAVTAYRRALELSPGNYKAHYGLARALMRRGEREAAREAMATYQRLYAAEQEKTSRENLERARLDRGWELLGQEDFEAAARHFASLAESAESLAGMARAWSRLGDHAKAAGLLERAVSLEPERQDLRMLLAQERLAAEGAP